MRCCFVCELPCCLTFSGTLIQHFDFKPSIIILLKTVFIRDSLFLKVVNLLVVCYKAITKIWVYDFQRQRLLFLTNCNNYLIFRGDQGKNRHKISSLPFYIKYFFPTVQREPLLVLLPGNLLWLRGIELQTCYEGQHSVL